MLSDCAVIFDMDGVLVDSIEPHWISWKISCERRGIELTREMYNGLFGRSFKGFVDALAPAMRSEDAAHWYLEKEELYRDIIREDFPEKAGASELIRMLNADSVLIGIASSGPRGNVDCLLELLPVSSLIHSTISADETVNTKPHPEPFLKCAELLGADPSRCAVIEDSVHGLRGAREAGMISIGITGTCPRAALELHADLVVNCLTELAPESVVRLINGC